MLDKIFRNSLLFDSMLPRLNGRTVNSVVLCCALLLQQLGGVLAGPGVNFNYNRNPTDKLGVYNWNKIHGSQCSGFRQSPINIQAEECEEVMPACSCPTLSYITPVVTGTFINNGHCPAFTLSPTSDITLMDVPPIMGSGRSARDVYRLHDFHLHYGGTTGAHFPSRNGEKGKLGPGSEHTVDGKRFDGELHFVFYNTRYGRIMDAMREPDGLVVVSFLIQQVPDSPSLSTETRQISDFIKTNVPKILDPNQNVTATMDLSMFFNRRRCEFFTYSGSTTTPMCVESVQWIIFKRPMKIIKDAWFTLSGLNSNGGFIRRYGNYRFTQPADGRVVLTNVGAHRRCAPILRAY